MEIPARIIRQHESHLSLRPSIAHCLASQSRQTISGSRPGADGQPFSYLGSQLAELLHGLEWETLAPGLSTSLTMVQVLMRFSFDVVTQAALE
jgi:hypothetical protein